MKAKDLMTKRLITVKPNDTIRKVVHILADKNISGCPVVAGDRLVGVVTQTDIVRAIDVYGKINKPADALSLIAAIVNSDKASTKSQLRSMLTTKVKDFMKSNVVFVEEGEDIYKAANLLNRHKIDRLPVVSAGKLVGILTKADIVKALGKLDN